MSTWPWQTILTSLACGIVVGFYCGFVIGVGLSRDQP